ncbi:MAG: FadR/GntR family transcriptional regulator [Desulfatiglandales bacterium]
MDKKTISFSPIKSKRAFEELSNHIKGLIIQGRLKTGDRLPSELELAEQFQVSRQTVREALRILELSGFITVRTGGKGGPTVSNTAFNTMNDLLLDVFQIERISMEEITVARLCIEKAVLAHAVENADEMDIKNLSKNIAQAKERVKGGRASTELNIEFHKLLGKASKNRVFQLVMGSIMSVLAHYHEIIPSDPQVSAKAVKYHEEVLAAIKAKDVDKALRMLEGHLEEVRERFKCYSDLLEAENG